MKQIPFVLFFLIIALSASSLSQNKKEVEPAKSVQKSLDREIQAFHKGLHPLVHDALPKGDFSTIRESLERLLERAKAIQGAQAPKKLAGRQKEIDDAASSLVSQLADMVSTKDKVDDATLEKMFNDMHETFEQLAEIVK
jgi:Zn-dependent M32 family carboxypeptidase